MTAPLDERRPHVRSRSLTAFAAAVAGAVALTVGAAAPALATDFTTVTCLDSGTKKFAGVDVTMAQAEHVNCSDAASQEYYEHYHSKARSYSTTVWTFSPAISSIRFEIAYNTDARESYEVVGFDSAGDSKRPSMSYAVKDEPDRLVTFSAPITKLYVRHYTWTAGDLAYFKFALPSHSLNVDVSGDGHVTSDVGGIDCGSGSADCSADLAARSPATTVTLTATPNGVNTFSGWTGCDSTSGNTCTVAMSKAQNVTASFSGPSYGYVAVETEGEGKVASTPAGVNVGLGGTDYEGEYIIPADVTLKATPKAGWKFVGWEGDACSGSDPVCVIALDDCLSVKAIFEKLPPQVNAVTTTPKEREGVSRIPVTFKSSGSGLARITISKCSGRRCTEKVLSRVTKARKGSNRLVVSTKALRRGRYTVTVSNGKRSSSTPFTVKAPRKRPAFTG